MTGKTFVLFLMEDKNYKNAATEAEQQQRIDLYRNWAITLRKEGIPIEGTKLQDEIHLLKGSAEEPLPASPTGEIAGYFLLDAASFQDAIRLAKSCPHLQFGGRIQVRRIHPV